jgi:hypothetical protein
MRTFRQVFLPYAFIGLGDRCFLPVNRNHKPIGCPDDWHDYRDHPSKIRIKNLTPAGAERIGLRGPGGAAPVEGGDLYLYDDATDPERSAANWRRYEAILAKLMKLEVQHVGTRRGDYHPGDTDNSVAF